MENREIKFRAWVTSSGVFSTEPHMATQGEPDIETLQSFMHHYSDEPLLMQFTGLKDKNGIEIYEGDIISKTAYNGEEYTLDGIVEYHVDGYALKCIGTNNDANIGSYYAMSVTSESNTLYKGEVIGSIYTTPHLLTTTQDKK